VRRGFWMGVLEVTLGVFFGLALWEIVTSVLP
jgi:hypothetical protein